MITAKEAFEKTNSSYHEYVKRSEEVRKRNVECYKKELESEIDRATINNRYYVYRSFSWSIPIESVNELMEYFKSFGFMIDFTDLLVNYQGERRLGIRWDFHNVKSVVEVKLPWYKRWFK